YRPAPAVAMATANVEPDGEEQPRAVARSPLRAVATAWRYVVAACGLAFDVLYKILPAVVPSIFSAILFMGYFYFLYGHVWPRAGDHAGINDFDGTMRGIAGSFLDAQWGLFVASPVYVLAIVGIVLMLFEQRWRTDPLWVGIVAVPYFLVVANYAQWWGEW